MKHWRHRWDSVSTTRAISLLGAFCLVVLLLFWAGVIHANDGPERYVRGATDFIHILTGAELIRSGQAAQLYDLEAQRAMQARILAPYLTLRPNMVLVFNHLPIEALALVPLLGLPYPLIFALWSGASVLAAGAALWLLARYAPLPGPANRAGLLLACAFPPLHLALWLGQPSAFVLLGLCGAWAALRHERPALAGVAFALVALKPQLLPILVLALCLQRRWRTLLVTAGVLAGGSIAMMPVLGVAWPLRYLLLLSGSRDWGAEVGVHPAQMENWRGLAVNLFGQSVPALVMPCVVGLSLLTVGLLLLAWWRAHPAGQGAGTAGQDDLIWALAILVAVPASLHLLPHDLSALVLPAWLLGRRALNGAWPTSLSRGWLALLGGGYLCSWLPLLASDAPAVAVIPTVSLLGAAIGLLAWQLWTYQGQSSPVPRAVPRQAHAEGGPAR
ncbi:MAG TPA: glycosyltransferase family 87 protein [Thermomicrobiales bacterium]|nr:glycosyltransferase family 87 protein [Thermomicrobiales bacterium]